MYPYQKIINVALEHIKEQQLPDGSFLSLSSNDPDNFSDAISYKTTFFASNILLALRAQDNSKEVQDKGINFLLSQKSENWSFNYIARTTEKNISSPYPDDLDDTFTALAAIAKYKPEKITGKSLAVIVGLLTTMEADQGGPFKTWIIPNDSSEDWQNIDVIVNSNIGYFLSLFDIQIPAIENFIAQAIEKNPLTSPYYPGFYQISYFISRFYKSQRSLNVEFKNIITRGLITHPQKNLYNLNLLEQAMVISSLINLGELQKIDPDFLASFTKQIEVEGFKPYPFCIDPKRKNKRAYAGSSALTAALCVEALTNYYATCNTLVKNINGSHHAHIQNAALKKSAKVGFELRETIIEQIKKTSDEKITLLANEVQDILKRNGKIISDIIIENLSLANFYGWMAYSIYDKVIDGDTKGKTALIPCANFFLRTLIDIYNILEKDIPGVQNLFYATMDTIDNALIWEQKHCKRLVSTENILKQKLPVFENYNNLAHRSIGHALPALVALYSFGYHTESKEYNTTLDLFNHYLIARQLHDDAHDWEEDLLRGNINSICTLLLKKFQKKYCEQSEIINLEKALPELRKMFWEEIIDETTELILFHVTAAYEAREKSAIFGTTDFMGKSLQNLWVNAKKALLERDKTIEFLNHYGATSPYGHNSQKPLSYS